jgi:hypothetical protein
VRASDDKIWSDEPSMRGHVCMATMSGRLLDISTIKSDPSPSTLSSKIDVTMFTV